jgi:hypothetical protein
LPGTNPFYPHRDEQQANRFLELMATHRFEVYLLNTGRVGGGPDEAGSKKVEIEHSGAIVEAIAEGTISWERDPDFGYEVASKLPGLDDVELLQPRRLYEGIGRAEEHAAWVDRLKRERLHFLANYPGACPGDPGRHPLGDHACRFPSLSNTVTGRRPLTARATGALTVNSCSATIARAHWGAGIIAEQ